MAYSQLRFRQGIVVIALLLVSISYDVSAGLRLKTVALVDDKPVTGLEVCFHPAGSDYRNYFQYYLLSRETHCVSGDRILDIPASRFLFYGHIGSDYVSSHPYETEGAAVQADALRRLAIELLPAARLDFTNVLSELGPDEYPAVYIPNNESDHFAPNIVPLPPGSHDLLVPARSVVVPMLVQEQTIRAAGAPLTIAEHDAVTLPSNAFPSRDRAVIAILELEDIGDRLPSKRFDTPKVNLVDSDHRMFDPVVELRKFGLFHRTLAIFRNLPPGTYELRGGGERWVADRLPVIVPEAGGVITPSRSLHLAPASRISVDWSMAGTAGVVPQQAGDCPPAADVDRILWTVSRCNTQEGAQCTPVFKSDAAIAGGGKLDVPPLRSGFYAVDAEFVTKRLYHQMVAVGQLETVALRPSLPLDTIHGTIRKGDQSVGAVLQFSNTSAVASASSGYVAPLPETIRANTPVRVTACDRSFDYVDYTRAALAAGGRFDSTVPDGRLEVRVRDNNGRPLPEASVSCALLVPGSDDAAIETIPLPLSDAEGRSSLRSALVGESYRCCAGHSGYLRECASPIVVRGSDSIEVSLVPAAKHVLTVRGAGNMVGSSAYFIAPDGVITEVSRAGTDGTFSVSRDHTAPETVVVVSPEQPIALIPIPPDAAGDLILDWPAATARTFDVALAPDDPRKNVLFTLQVGQLLLPQDVINRFLLQRRSNGMLHPGSTVRLTVLHVAPLAVVATPDLSSVKLPPGADVFSVPEFRNLPRIPVTGATVVLH